MTVRIEVRESSIHGKGVFSAEAIPAGMPIGTYQGAPTSRNGQHVLWTNEPDGRVRGVRGTNELRYVNHSSSPNGEFDGTVLYAIEDIEDGAEITVDYGEEWR